MLLAQPSRSARGQRIAGRRGTAYGLATRCSTGPPFHHGAGQTKTGARQHGHGRFHQLLPAVGVTRQGQASRGRGGSHGRSQARWRPTLSRTADRRIHGTSTPHSMAHSLAQRSGRVNGGSKARVHPGLGHDDRSPSCPFGAPPRMKKGREGSTHPSIEVEASAGQGLCAITRGSLGRRWASAPRCSGEMPPLTAWWAWGATSGTAPPGWAECRVVATRPVDPITSVLPRLCRLRSGK